MINQNQISVCVPTYKRLELLTYLLSNIPEDIEVKLSDNGGHVIRSGYRSLSNVTAYPTDKIITMFENWDRATDLITTDWFIIPGDDDIIKKEMFTEALKAIQKYPDAGMIIFGHEIIDGNNNVTDKWCPQKETKLLAPDGFNEVKNGVAARWPSIVFNTERFRSVGKFDTDFKDTASDSWLIQKMSLNFPVVFVPKIMGQYRVWKDGGTARQIIRKDWFEQIDLWMRKLEEYFDAHPDTALKYDIRKIKSDIMYSNQIFALRQMKCNGSSPLERYRFIKGIPRLPKYSIKRIANYIIKIVC